MKYEHASFDNAGLNAIDTESLPVATIDAMVRRGLNHYFGNELAAKITAWKTKNEKHTPEQLIDYTDSVYAAAMAAVLNGTVGMGRSGSGRTTDRVLQRAIEMAIETIRGNPTKYGFVRVWSKNDSKDVRAKAKLLVKKNPAYMHLAEKYVAELAEMDADVDVDDLEPADDAGDESEDETDGADGADGDELE